MATFSSTYLYTLTPGGTGQYTVNGQVPDAEAGGAEEAGSDDGVFAPGEPVTVTFATQSALDGEYTYLGHEPGIPGYVAQGPDGLFYLFANTEVPLNQNFNIQADDVPICFMAGTMIACPDGERPIEDLRAGDMVLSASGMPKPIRWIGRQTVASLFADPLRSSPVCVTAGALAPQIPTRDLYVSPDHALLVDGVLVQAAALVNGLTIRRLDKPPALFTLYHIELEDHALILAEGAEAETFVDNVRRRRFDNYREYAALYGDGDARIPELALPRAKSARQLPRAVRERLAARAAALGFVSEAAA
ncbi:Hint domain-containing protein [Chelatococcus reniformis]|uniref:Hedgehog/Intein (Hint) domain-containing protein n=1 Tax=Chelatococcus reniformis TaxID=1494448 RepID=A0A916UMV7_9HYPH|nr:Hint domain-containing protein [Chelatococcus reniformis]GGC79363.1 hypothetical protein GCM10010994_41800 [Chelatococcus reniformis]